jgi:hypothetical protein
MAALEWGKPTAGWQLSVSLDKNQILWTQPVFATIVLKNVAGEKQTVHQTSRWAYDLQVEDDEGEVPRTRFGMGIESAREEASYVPTVLAPGETFTCEIPLSRMFDLSEGGVFRLRVSRDMPGTKPAGEARVSSNEITFEVVEE